MRKRIYLLVGDDLLEKAAALLLQLRVLRHHHLVAKSFVRVWAFRISEIQTCSEGFTITPEDLATAHWPRVLTLHILPSYKRIRKKTYEQV